MAGDESVRLFCALHLPEGTLDELTAWQERLGAVDARRVPRGHLHVTLAFLGARPREELPAIAAALRDAGAAAGPVRLAPLRYRETGSVGMVVLADEGGRAGALAVDLHRRLEALGVYRVERRDWLAHVTVLRFRERPGLRPSLHGLGASSPSDAAVYSSVLRSTGAQYEVIESFALGG